MSSRNKSAQISITVASESTRIDDSVGTCSRPGLIPAGASDCNDVATFALSCSGPLQMRAAPLRTAGIRQHCCPAALMLAQTHRNTHPRSATDKH